MGLFSKPKPKKQGIFGGLRAASRDETHNRIQFTKQRSGLSAEAINEYKRGRADAEDVRRELARNDDYFRHADVKDVKDALDKE